MFLRTFVQHHPSRADLLPGLLAALDGLDPQVITDPGGRQKSSWRTYRLCLESIPGDATHACIIQDDAIPCDHFAEAVRAAIEERPTRVIALFMSGIGHLMRRANIARKNREHWLELPPSSYVPLVATIFPADIARAIPRFADSRKIPVARADDAVVGTYCRAHRIMACATVPSLVEHDATVVSVTGYPTNKDGAHRKAAWFVDDPLALRPPAVVASP